MNYIVRLVTIAAIVCAADADEGKCAYLCGSLNPKPNVNCIQGAKPEQKSCHEPDAKPYYGFMENYCECEPGTVRQCYGRGRYDCIKPEDCDMDKPKCTNFF